MSAEEYAFASGPLPHSPRQTGVRELCAGCPAAFREAMEAAHRCGTMADSEVIRLRKAGVAYAELSELFERSIEEVYAITPLARATPGHLTGGRFPMRPRLHKMALHNERERAGRS